MARKPAELSPAPPLSGNKTETLEEELEDLFEVESETSKEDENWSVRDKGYDQNHNPGDVLFGAEHKKQPKREVTPEMVQALLALVDMQAEDGARIVIPRLRQEQVRQVQTLLRSHYQKAPHKASLQNIVSLAIEMMIEDMEKKGGKSKYFKRLSRL